MTSPASEHSAGPPIKLPSRYTFPSELGSGRFAKVFAATDNELRREVALKVISLAGRTVDQQ